MCIRDRGYSGSEDELGGKTMAEKLLEVKNLRTEFKRDKTWAVSYTHLDVYKRQT